ncbi:MAG: hypothetical protein HXS52_05415 [Theionarchaea archaeon]|nr:hypothetical protein [Theionarchaea archaeon]
MIKEETLAVNEEPFRQNPSGYDPVVSPMQKMENNRITDRKGPREQGDEKNERRH